MFLAMFHGTGGPIRVEKDKLRTLEKYWFKAAREKGFPITNMSPVQREGMCSVMSQVAVTGTGTDSCKSRMQRAMLM